MLTLDYPTGFTFTSAAPAPTVNKDTWAIGDLQPGATRTFVINGTFDGKEGEEKVFTASVGRESSAEDKIEAVYTAATEKTVLQNASLALQLLFNGSEQSNYTSISGDRIRVDLAWKNTLPVKIQNAEIDIKLEGEALNRFSVSVGKTGFYRSVDNTIVWTTRTLPDLVSIEPGASGVASFTLESTQLSSTNNFTQNPRITMTATATGRSVDPDGTPKDITISLAPKTIDVQTAVALAGQTLYYTGPFANNGPIPPKAEQRTTYTILWTVTNSSNDIRNGKVTATLPEYVDWLGSSGSGFNENISFNPVGGQITWNLGDIKAGTGIVRPARQVAFQIALTPSITQINGIPDLTSDITFVGEDIFTKAQITKSIKGATTQLTGDPSAQTGSERVLP
jgi:hypothetical protein